MNTGWGGGRRPLRSSRWSAVHGRGPRGGDGAWAIVRGSHGGRPVVRVRKGWKTDNEAILMWRDSGVGVGGLVSELRCPLVRAHPQKMLVSLWSICRRVKTVLSFLKSRVFSRTRFLHFSEVSVLAERREYSGRKDDDRDGGVGGHQIAGGSTKRRHNGKPQ